MEDTSCLRAFFFCETEVTIGRFLVYNWKVIGYNWEVLDYYWEFLVFIVYKKKTNRLNG